MSAPAQDQAEAGADPFENGYDPANVERIYRGRLVEVLDRLAEAKHKLWAAEEDAKVSREFLAVTDRRAEKAERENAEARAELTRLRAALSRARPILESVYLPHPLGETDPAFGTEVAEAAEQIDAALAQPSQPGEPT